MGIGEGSEQRSEAIRDRPQWEGERAIKDQTENEKAENKGKILRRIKFLVLIN